MINLKSTSFPPFDSRNALDKACDHSQTGHQKGATEAKVGDITNFQRCNKVRLLWFKSSLPRLNK